MTDPEPWELDDEQIWGEVDHATLTEAFRRSEISEAREAKAARRSATPQFFFRQFTEMLLALYDHAEAQLEQINESTRLMIEHMNRPQLPAAPSAKPSDYRRLRRRSRYLPPVPTLLTALAANARPSPGPRKRLKTPHAQRH